MAGTLMTNDSRAGVRFSFPGAPVLITGGSHGIGLELAREFADAGATVTITGRRASAAEYETDLARFRYLQLEVSDNAQVDSIAAQLGQLDILINNAGEPFPGGDQWNPDNFELAVKINLTSGFRMAVASRARTLGVAGWVRNRADGTVEAVFAGEPDAVDALVRWCSDGPRGAAVSRVDVDDVAHEELTSFEIR